MMATVGILVLIAAILAGVFALLVWLLGLIATMAISFALVSLLMMLVILIQKPKGGGLSGAFGGGGGGAEAAFGAKTGDVLTKVTIACFVVFLALAMGLTWAISPSLTPPIGGAPTPTGAQPGAPTSEQVPTNATPDSPAEQPAIPDNTGAFDTSEPAAQPEPAASPAEGEPAPAATTDAADTPTETPVE